MRQYTELEQSEIRQCWRDLRKIVNQLGDLGIRPWIISARIDRWGPTPSLAPDDDERLGLLAESAHVAWRKGVDHPYASAIHRLISEMRDGSWGQYVTWLDWCLREVGYSPRPSTAKQPVPPA